MVTPASIQGSLDADTEYDSAMARAGRFLTLKARTEFEVRDRLLGAGYDPKVVDRVLDRLREMKLVDDTDFARSWIEERMRKKGSGPQLLRAELEGKGIDATLIDEAVESAFPDEVARAEELAAELLPKWSGLSLERQASRLSGALTRKGFSNEAVQAGLRAVLPPEGWD